MPSQDPGPKGNTKKPGATGSQNENRAPGPMRVYANRYKVLEKLGSGQFGTVFLVEDSRLNPNDLYLLFFVWSFFP